MEDRRWCGCASVLAGEDFFCKGSSVSVVTKVAVSEASDEVGFGANGEISIEDITGSLTEAARAVNFERRGLRGQLGTKDTTS